MSGLSSESTPRERLLRLLALMKRIRRFSGTLRAMAAVGLSLALAAALATKRFYRSETTVLYRDGIQTRPGEGESPANRVARLGPKLKDLLYARPRMEEVIREHDLFPEKARRSMLDALEEMASATGFRARASDSYVISFTYDDPAVARDVAADLAARMIEAYDRQNLDTATLTRDFLARKEAEADAAVEESSRKLSQFLAEHPQFQWGMNDSPYAPVPGTTPGAASSSPSPRTVVATDPAVAQLEHDLARTEAELYAAPAGSDPSRPPALPGAGIAEAQKQRDAAAGEVAAAETARREKLLQVKPAHPDAVAAEARVRAAHQALAIADAALLRARTPVATPREPASTLQPARRTTLEQQAAVIRRRIEERRSAMARPPAPVRSPTAPASATTVELETEWHRLRLELDQAREKLHTLQQNARAAELAADAAAREEHEEMRVLEPAYLPVRPERGRGRIFFFWATVALCLALAVSTGRVLLDDTILDEGDVATLGGPPVLVTLPHLDPPPAPPAARAIVPAVPREDDLDDDPPLSSIPVPSERSLALCVGQPIIEAVFEDPEVEVIGSDRPPEDAQAIASVPPAALGALRVLRSRLEQRRGDGSLVIAVLSPGPTEGKTTLALRLAATLSEADRARVILVEGNFDRPRLSAALGVSVPADAAFSTQIHDRRQGRCVPWGVIRLTPSLSLLAETAETAAHPEAIHSTHFEAALAALRRSHDYVVIDGPAVVGSGDANVVEGASDGVLLLLRLGVTKGADLSRATQQLGERRVLGVVLNDGEAAGV